MTTAQVLSTCLAMDGLPEAILSLVLEKQCSYTKYGLGKIECYSFLNSWKMYVVSAVAVKQSRRSDPRHSMTKIQVGGLHATIICLEAMRQIITYISSKETLASQLNFARRFPCLVSSLRHTNGTSFAKFDLLLHVWMGAWAVVWEVYTCKSSGAEIVVALSFGERGNQ